MNATARPTLLYAAISSALGVLIGLSVSTGHSATLPSTANNAPGATLALPDFAALVDQAGPAVVNISVSGSRTMAAQALPDLGPFAQFFGPGIQQQPQQQMIHGEGSGFIVDASGIVLTNAHVVKDASEVQVKLTDRREFKARVLGVDERTDVAVLRIDADHLPTVQLGDSSRLRPGSWVVAIGSPFGFENTVTSGIVSAKARSLPGDGAVPFIQTDVAVNPGNSGGPLFDLNGRVVGINSQIYSQTGGYQGVSFAIPIEVALNAEKQIIATGKVAHGKLGVVVQTLTQDLARAFGLNDPNGALISKVEPGSAADAAGLKPGDVIRSLNGNVISDSGALSAAIAMTQPDTKVQLQIWRERREESVSATLKPDARTEVLADAISGNDASELGLTVRPLDPQERRDSHLRAGVVVENCDGIARQAGIEPGDVLLKLNGQPLNSPDDLRRGVAAAKGDSAVALLILRGDAALYVPIPLATG